MTVHPDQGQLMALEREDTRPLHLSIATFATKTECGLKLSSSEALPYCGLGAADIHRARHEPYVCPKCFP